MAIACIFPFIIFGMFDISLSTLLEVFSEVFSGQLPAFFVTKLLTGILSLGGGGGTRHLGFV